MVAWLARLGRSWYVAAAAALVAVTAFGATIQAGVLAPQFHTTGGSGTGGTQLVSFQNDSWRSWTITRVHFPNRSSASARVEGRTMRLTLHEGPIVPPHGQLGPGLARLSIGPGEQFSVGLSNSDQTCPYNPRRGEPPFPDMIEVRADFTVSTPFGLRDVGVRFSVQRCRSLEARPAEATTMGGQSRQMLKVALMLPPLSVWNSPGEGQGLL